MMARNLAILAAFVELPAMLSKSMELNTEITKMHNLILCGAINDADYDELDCNKRSSSHNLQSSLENMTDVMIYRSSQPCLNFPKSSRPQQDRWEFYI